MATHHASVSVQNVYMAGKPSLSSAENLQRVGWAEIWGDPNATSGKKF